jgi:hypothetical protein
MRNERHDAASKHNDKTREQTRSGKDSYEVTFDKSEACNTYRIHKTNPILVQTPSNQRPNSPPSNSTML